MGAPITIDYVADWKGRLLSRMYEQFKDKANLVALANLCGRQFQDLEDAFQSILALFDTDNSEGAQLDLLGRVVGQPRGGLDDATYRLYLKARVLANDSTGGPEDIYDVINALYGLPMVFNQGRLKAFELRVKAPITLAQAAVGPVFLRAAKEAGARANFTWQEYDDSAMLTYALCGCLTALLGMGSTTINLTGQTSGFPPSGQVVLDPGLANAETVTYVAITGGGVLQLTGATGAAHQAGAVVEVVGDAGLGLGDSSNAATGGRLAGSSAA